MEKIGLLLAIATVSCTAATPVWAVKPLPEKLSMAHKWVAENFKAPASVVASKAEAAKAPEAGLVVIANNDPVQRNERLGKPLKIRDTEYTRGLFCHALSKVLVRLPGAGKTFTSFIGLDANGCAGSVVFSVRVGNTVAFKSPVMKQGMVQAFRRADCPDDTMRAHLQGLDKNADYVVTDIDTQKPVRMSGNELMKSGLLIRAESKPAAFVFTYKRAGN